ncbi:helix-turn-helix domain-containing protein [Sediminibacterium sp.]|uniref:helix-turn-helix domain-containing protein n=1 Tax=Sediminibacterium sp. TaxID=1917865 RepID=UPI003F69F678
MLYGEKIRLIREMRGYSQEYMAAKLGIAQNTYSNVETNKTKITVEMLEGISKELNVSPMELLNNEPAIINFGSVTNSMQGVNHVEHFHTYQKEMLENFKQITESILKTNERILKLLEDRMK